MSRRRPARVSAPALVATLAALAAGAAVGWFARPLVPPTADRPAATPGSPPTPETISALARLQPRGGVIPVYGPPGDRIGAIADLKPGTPLNAGDRIADLASRKERATEVEVAELQVREADRQLELAKATGRLKIAAAELEASQLTADEEQDKKGLDAQVAVLEKNRQFAAAQGRRLDDLSAKGVRVPDEEREQANLLMAKADAEKEAALLKRERAVSGYARGRELAAAKVAAAKAEVAEAVARVPLESSRKKVALAKQVLDLTVVKAPVAGRVLKVNAHLGEPTGAQQPILYLADTGAMVAVAEVYESDVARLREWLGKGGTFAVAVGSPALPKGTNLVGSVRGDDQVTRMIARNAAFAVSPREDSDRRVVEVTVDLDAASAAVAALYVGLQVSADLSPVPAAAAPPPAPKGR